MFPVSVWYFSHGLNLDYRGMLYILGMAMVFNRILTKLLARFQKNADRQQYFDILLLFYCGKWSRFDAVRF